MAGLILCAIGGRASYGQFGGGSKSVPKLSYYFAMEELLAGETRDALDDFQRESRSSIKTAQSRWIDSICYHAMIGESYYAMGEYRPALENYTAAVRIYLGFSDWMIRVRFPASIALDTNLARLKIPWGASQRKFRLGRVPNTIPISQGRINNADAVQRGGVVQKAMLFPINVHEIVRCTALAIRRRSEIMGMLSPYDPLTAQIVARLSARPGPPNHWSEAWIDLQLGLAQAGAGKLKQAQRHLQRAVVLAGEFDHPLTCIALLELGRLAMEGDDLAGAARFFEEAGYSATYYKQYGALEEAMRLGSRVHLISNQKGPYPPLELAFRWARRKRLRRFQVTLATLQAEHQAEADRPDLAVDTLRDARALIGRRDMASETVGARIEFLLATAAFQKAKLQEASASLRSVMSFQQQRSLWLFQIGLANRLYASGSISPRVAMTVYRKLLRDPGPEDWTAEPREAFTKLSIPQSRAFDNWFDAALKRKEIDSALSIADRARRHRFLTSLPMGGRLLGLRWVLEAPWLSPETILERQDLRVRYPEYDQLSQQARTARDRLAALPLEPEDDEGKREQMKLYQSLAQKSAAQEAMLRAIALRRQPASIVFPPILKTKDLQASLPKGTAILVFYRSGQNLHGFLINGQKYTHWKVVSRSRVRKGIIKLLREIGLHDANRELSLADLQKTAWKTVAAKLTEDLFEGARVNLSEGIERLVIVPDAELWYLPFEALSDGEDPVLNDRTLVHYAPLASLAVPGNRVMSHVEQTGIVAGALFPRDPPEVSAEAAASIVRVLPEATVLRSPLSVAPSLYASRIQRLVVLDDLRVDPGKPYAFSPIAMDRSRKQGSLSQWMLLPWGGPEQIILPGFHSAAENSLKRESKDRIGQDPFLSICGLMATGARTILLSRWRVGGQTSIDLVREFTQELPHSMAAEAWKRSVALASEHEIDWQREPRIKRFEEDSPPRADHPFFWSGYMLIDTGVSPRTDPDDEAE